MHREENKKKGGGECPKFSHILLSILDLSILYKQLPPTTSVVCDTRQKKKGRKNLTFDFVEPGEVVPVNILDEHED